MGQKLHAGWPTRGLSQQRVCAATEQCIELSPCFIANKFNVNI